MLASFLPNKTEEMMFAIINQTIIGAVRFSSFVVEFQNKFLSFVDIGVILFCITRKEIACCIFKSNLIFVDGIYSSFYCVCCFHVEANEKDEEDDNVYNIFLFHFIYLLSLILRIYSSHFSLLKGSNSSLNSSSEKIL